MEIVFLIIRALHDAECSFRSLKTATIPDYEFLVSRPREWFELHTSLTILPFRPVTIPGFISLFVAPILGGLSLVGLQKLIDPKVNLFTTPVYWVISITWLLPWFVVSFRFARSMAQCGTMELGQEGVRFRDKRLEILAPWNLFPVASPGEHAREIRYDIRIDERAIEAIEFTVAGQARDIHEHQTKPFRIRKRCGRTKTYWEASLYDRYRYPIQDVHRLIQRIAVRLM